MTEKSTDLKEVLHLFDQLGMRSRTAIAAFHACLLVAATTGEPITPLLLDENKD